MATKEPSVAVSIYTKDKGTLDKCREEKGLSQVELVSRLVRWYAVQDKTLQNIILGNEDPTHEVDILDMIKRQMTSSK